MSTDLGIAGVTRALRNLLGRVAMADFSNLPNDTRPTAGIEITTLPLDRVRNGNGGGSGNRLNLFLYHAEPSAAYRNMDPPRQVRPGETAPPMLALNLYYIITAYGEDDSELVAHTLLGAAMRLLHDHPVLSREELSDALQASELEAQFERIRITPQPTSLDEISKLWTGFQSEYRLSSAYHVSVVLIESQRPSRAPLPVLNRGKADRGPIVLAGAGPTLTEIKKIYNPAHPDQPRNGKPSAELGDALILRGDNLPGDSVTALFRHKLLDEPLERPLQVEPNTSEVEVALPSAGEPGVPAAWPTGLYTVELRVEGPDDLKWSTNRLPFMLAPSIDSIGPITNGRLTITCRPQVRFIKAESGEANVKVFLLQPVSLLLGKHTFPVLEEDPDDGSNITAPADDNSPTALEFQISGIEPGSYVARLRVDGVDSMPIDFTAEPLEFDAGQKVIITP